MRARPVSTSGIRARPLAARMLQAGLSDFDPRMLFAANEQGGWYDPSDFSTLFQDSAGTTPVTAVGQSVGLVLDKRLGLVLGSERIINGDFSASTTGWTLTSAGASSVTATSGGVRVYSPAGETAALAQTPIVAFENGAKYLVEFDVTMTSGVGYAFLGDTSGSASRFTFSTSGRKRAILTKGSVSSTFGISREAAGADFIVDNISVKELPGNHATQTTAGNRPVLRQDANGMYYLEFDGATSNRWLQTASINFTGTDKATVWLGTGNMSPTTTGVLCELSASSTVAGGFSVYAPRTAGVMGASIAGTGGARVGSSFSADATSRHVVSIAADLSASGHADEVKPRLNASAAALSSMDTTGDPTGAFGNHALYIGRRGGTTLPFNGRIYGLIIRGAASNAGQIAAGEAWMNGKTRAY